MYDVEMSTCKAEAKRNLHEAYLPWVLVVLLLSFAANVTTIGTTLDNYHIIGESMNYDMSFLPNIPTSRYGSLVSLVLTIFVLDPLLVACCGTLVSEDPQTLSTCIKRVFQEGNYWKVVKVMLVRQLWILAGMIFFIVPGIILAYKYYYTPIVCYEYIDQSYDEIMSQSYRMQDGRKMDFFVLDLSFFFWMIASLLTFGIGGILYVNPYYRLTWMHYYKGVKHQLYR